MSLQRYFLIVCCVLFTPGILVWPKPAAAETRMGGNRDYSVYQRSWRQAKKGLKDALLPRFSFRRNFFGVHYKNFVLGDTLTFKDGEYSVELSKLNSNFNAWGVFYVNFYDALRTRFATNFYEYVKFEHSYEPSAGTTVTANQIKLNEVDFSLAYTIYISKTLPVYAGAGLTAGHMKVQGTSQSHIKTIGYLGGKLVAGASYIFDETLYLDACYYSLPRAMNSGYATTIGMGLSF